MTKVTVTLYMDEKDKAALQKLTETQERSLSQMALMILALLNISMNYSKSDALCSPQILTFAPANSGGFKIFRFPPKLGG